MNIVDLKTRLESLDKADYSDEISQQRLFMIRGIVEAILSEDQALRKPFFEGERNLRSSDEPTLARYLAGQLRLVITGVARSDRCSSEGPTFCGHLMTDDQVREIIDKSGEPIERIHQAFQTARRIDLEVLTEVGSFRNLINHM